jgi:hypothetical protein
VLVRAPEPLDGLRIVATPAALDHAYYEGDVLALRIAADEVFAIGAVHAELSDEHAIVEPETTFVGWTLTAAEFDRHVRHHLEWALPEHRPALAQGYAARVPVKLWLDHDHVLLVVSRGMVHEAVDRLGVPT